MLYELNITELSGVDIAEGESLESFYGLVNKRGVLLNPAEVNKAQYHSAPFMMLVNELMDLQDLLELDIFSTQTVLRMNDRSLIEELVALLIKKEITDKRRAVDELLNSNLDNEVIANTRTKFTDIIKVINDLNKINPINKTRFKQRNDFYTLFSYVAKHVEIPINVLKEQYRFLIFIDEHNYIRPTNESCQTFMKYAYHCVTQSNSKDARKTRLTILENILIKVNQNENNSYLADVIDFLEDDLHIEQINFVKIEKWYIIDFRQFQ